MITAEGVSVVLLVLVLGGIASLWYAVRPLPPKLEDLHRKVDELPGGTNDQKPILDAIEGARQQLSAHQDVSEARWRHVTEAINWLKARFERFLK